MSKKSDALLLAAVRGEDDRAATFIVACGACGEIHSISADRPRCDSADRNLNVREIYDSFRDEPLLTTKHALAVAAARFSSINSDGRELLPYVQKSRSWAELLHAAIAAQPEKDFTDVIFGYRTQLVAHAARSVLRRSPAAVLKTLNLSADEKAAIADTTERKEVR